MRKNDYYQRNKEKVKAQVRAWQDKNSDRLDARRKRKEQIVSLMKSVGCIDCGWDRVPEVLEFHHINVGDQSHQSPSSLISNRAVSIDRLVNELAKGIYLCPTCHALRHFDRQARRMDKRKTSPKNGGSV